MGEPSAENYITKGVRSAGHGRLDVLWNGVPMFMPVHARRRSAWQRRAS